MSDFDFAIDLIQSEPWPIARHVFIAAEIGINHNGDVEIAKQLVAMAHAAGCDAVKFQKRTIDVVYANEFLDSPRESPWGRTQREQKEALEFGVSEYDELDAFCRELGIAWFASSWDVESQHFLRSYNLRYNKVASAMLTHEDLLEAVAEERKPTLVSTGMTDDAGIGRAVEILRSHDCPFVLMHTVSQYPAPDAVLNLRAMGYLRERYHCPVGYSGHEVGPTPSIIAAAMGAVAVERHITIDRAMYGSDQAASLERRGLEILVSGIRDISVVVGDGTRRITDKELEVAQKLRYWESSSERPGGSR